jgi:hypothetical protein
MNLMVRLGFAEKSCSYFVEGFVSRRRPSSSGKAHERAYKQAPFKLYTLVW